MKFNQSGRSMIEMLGVLAIVGILSVGGLDLVSKARRSNQMGTLISSISNLAGTIVQQRKYAPEIKESYGSDIVLFLKQTGKIPTGLTIGSKKDGFYQLTGELNSLITANLPTTDDDERTVTLSISGLDKETCIKVVSNNWGNMSGKTAATIKVGDGDGDKTATGQMSIADATAG